MYAKDPADVINYISKHDNETLWDKLQLELPFYLTNEQRVRVQNVSHSIVLLSQGIPFVQLGGDFLRSKSLDRNTYDAGDWFNWVDFTMMSNNWNVGLPLDKGGKIDQELVSLASSQYTSVGITDMEFASTVFNEFLNIRQSSPLFKLTTAQDIIDRVGFHNIGKNQTQSLVVMSIDDGVGFEDLDANYDAVVVVVNGSEQELSHTVATAAGFELHPTLTMSVDGTVSAASFSEGENDGTFTVPALTTAVFVKPQGETQGTGLSAFATSGAPDVVPYGDTVVYVRGGMNGWGEVDAMSYVGNGVYQVAIDLAAGDYEFKIASGDWSTVNNGADGTAELGADLTLVPGSNSNIKLSITEATSYLFSLDASDTAAPVLTVNYEEPFYGTTVFIRGDMNSWSENNPLTYVGGGIYKATFSVSAAVQNFKVASADWSTVNYGAPDDDQELLLGEDQLLVSGSNSNFNANFDTEENYTFTFDASNLNEPTLSVYKSELFTDTTVYVRGDMNGWGEVDALVYQGDGSYSADIELDAGSYGFKLASADWSTFNIGANETSAIAIGISTRLAHGANPGNLSIEIAESGTYRFTVSGPSSETPTLTVTKN